MERLALTINGTPIEAPTGVPTNISLGSLETGFIIVAIVIGIILSIFYMAYGGFYWLQSKGDKERLDKARRIIIYALVGLILMSLSLVIVNLVASALGVKTLLM